MRNDFCSNYLGHSGIPGMKWYQRRYQNPDGSLTPAGRERYGVGGERKKKGIVETIKENKAAKKKAKQRKAALEKARQAKVAKAKQAQKEKEFQENKEKILKSGNATEVLKYKGQMSNQELNAALNRINWERQLSQISAAENKSNFDKVDDIMKKVSKVGDWANASYKTYTAINRVIGLASDKDKKK